jgi:hypothetical protein
MPLFLSKFQFFTEQNRTSDNKCYCKTYQKTFQLWAPSNLSEAYLKIDVKTYQFKVSVKDDNYDAWINRKHQHFQDDKFLPT